MKTTYLNEYQKLVDTGLVYIPTGTLEWHGSFLPIETDFLVAQGICEIFSKDFPGLILPPIFFGGGSSKIVNGQRLYGMDRKVGKFLPGNLYHTKSKALLDLFQNLIDHLTKQGFTKIVIVSGHGSSNQTKVMEKLVSDNSEVLYLNPYDLLAGAHHADEHETSLLWALYPDEESKSRSVEIPIDDDLINFIGYNPRDKASLDLGKKHLQTIISSFGTQLKTLI